MRWTHLVTLMDAEAMRQGQDNDHAAAVLLREGAEAIRSAFEVGELMPSIQIRHAVAQYQMAVAAHLGWPNLDKVRSVFSVDDNQAP